MNRKETDKKTKLIQEKCNTVRKLVKGLEETCENSKQSKQL